MKETDTKKATKRSHVLVNAHVEADVSGMLWYRGYKTEEERAKDLKRACKEFQDFLRDHRSQDLIYLEVVREYKDLCSACNERWEPDTDENGTFCANCGATIEEKSNED